jgi:excisionase family DNA binding protein
MSEPNPHRLPDDLIPPRVAAGILPRTSEGNKVSLRSIYRWIRDGKLPSWRIGRRYFVSKSDVLGLVRPVPVKPVPAVARHEGHAEAMRQLREVYRLKV